MSKALKPSTATSKVSKSTVKSKATTEPKVEEFPSSDEEDFPSSEDSNGDGSDDSDDSEDLEGFDGFASSDDDEETEQKDAKKVQPKSVNEEAIKKKIAKLPKGNTESRGVIYVGRIPHGFYEDQMKSYFSQFGDITRLRLSRNKKTGKSKHYAFIEFESSEVARVVSETMDNYLLFGHILKVKLIPTGEVHESLFKGSNKTYKHIPWSKVSKYQHDKPKSEEQLKELNTKFEKSIKSKEATLKSLGIDYDFSTSATKTQPKKKAVAKKTKKSKK